MSSSSSSSTVLTPRYPRRSRNRETGRDHRSRNEPSSSLDEEDVLNQTEDETELFVSYQTDIDVDQIPEPELSEEERCLPPKDRERRILLKKCRMVNSYNFYSLDHLVNLLTPSDNSVHRDYSYVIANYVIGPEEFYINWAEDVDKIQLLDYWLSSSIMDGEIENIHLNVSMIGKTVSALFDATGFWKRARVLELGMYDKIAIVYYVDHGLTRDMDACKIRALPDELASIPDFALKCKLAGVSFNAENQMDEATRKEFCWDVGMAEGLKCKLKYFNPINETFAVKLRIVEGPGAPRNFNHIIRKKYQFCKSINKLIVEDKQRSVETPSRGMYKNHEVHVRCMKEMKLKGLRMFRVAHVNTPTDFCIEYIMEVDMDMSTTGSAWHMEMQIFYKNPENCSLHKLATSRPLINRCYAVRSGLKYGWQRCCVTRRKDGRRTCEVALVDIGMIVETPWEGIHELNPLFSHVPALGFRAFLVDISPPNNQCVWPEETNKAFKKMAEGKVFHGIITAIEKCAATTTVDQLNTALGIILVERNSTEANPLALNAQLCMMELASASGIAGGIPLPSYTEEKFNFEAMKLALLAEDPSRDVKELELNAPTMTNANSNDDFLSFRKESHGTANAAAHVPLSWNSKDEPEPLLKCFNRNDKGAIRPDKLPRNMLEIPKEIRNSLTSGTISHVVSPSCFYIQMTPKLIELRQMMKYIEAQVEETPEMEKEKIVAGLEVAVLLYDESNETAWYRGIVRNAMQSINLAKVILVDYGNEVAVKYKALRPLPTYFMEIPGCALRVHLDVAGLVPAGGPWCAGWSTEAITTFRQYLALWQDANPVYYILRQPGSQLIPLDFYGQELTYDAKGEKWMKRLPLPGAPVMEAELTAVRLSNTRPLIRNLCRSIGIDVAYETITDANQAYKFDKAWDILVDRGLAILTNKTNFFKLLHPI